MRVWGWLEEEEKREARVDRIQILVFFYTLL